MGSPPDAKQRPRVAITVDAASIPVDDEQDRSGQWVLRRAASNGVMSVDNQMFSVTNAFTITGCVAAGGPVWSPDGRRIAFTVEGHDSVRQLFVMNADGSGVHPLIAKTSDVCCIAWQPIAVGTSPTSTPPVALRATRGQTSGTDGHRGTTRPRCCSGSPRSGYLVPDPGGEARLTCWPKSAPRLGGTCVERLHQPSLDISRASTSTSTMTRTRRTARRFVN